MKIKKWFVGCVILAFSTAASFAAAPNATVSPDLLAASVDLIITPFVVNSAAIPAASHLNESLLAERENVIQAVANDAADSLNEYEPTPLLKQVESTMRSELSKRGNKHDYTDSELARMIISQAIY
ncbi:MAG: hypothetical protein P4M08_14035 [Oligoflexia bacterium]|nr:hypothetical protein [Oligoflexia bacterium]